MIVSMELIKQIRKAYREYCKNEFGNDIQTEEDVLDLMYTTVDDENWEVQVSYNLSTEYLVTSITNGYEKYTFEETHLVEDMLQDLQYGDFQGWYSYAHDICDERFSLDLEW